MKKSVIVTTIAVVVSVVCGITAWMVRTKAAGISESA